jgi:hypothetical protein
MFSKKQLVNISLILAILFHFIFYFNLYGPPVNQLKTPLVYLIAIGSAAIIIFLYFGTYWRSDLRRSSITILFDLFVLWIFICFFRSLLEMRSRSELTPFLFSNYAGLALFPVFFFTVGININYFFQINRILLFYLIIATLFSLFFITHFELQLFLVMPIFYIILTIPQRNAWNKLLIILISASVIIVSLTNRAGIMRILISYCIVLAYYFMSGVRINKRFLKLIVFCILMIPVVSMYLGINGQSVFQVILGESNDNYSQLNPYADTRTFLYYEVFQDLKLNEAFLFGKGLNAGYMSVAFDTASRSIVEVGFLQILLKTGIVGCFFYFSIIISAIFKALGKSKNLYVKSLGLLLSGYILMLFVENVIAYNLLNIIIWIVVGMCHSEKLREISNDDIKTLFTNSKYVGIQPKSI